MNKALSISLTIGFTVLYLAVCGTAPSEEKPSTPRDVEPIRQNQGTATSLSESEKILQRLILDFRYFCTDGTPSERCRTPVTKLDDKLRDLLTYQTPGGVILFAENIKTPTQTITLIDDMQTAALSGDTKIPLLISIDQEGGKVTRLPLDWATGFAGNMAIAATPPNIRETLAYDVGYSMGAELSLLGFNVNHAPVLDVNSNAANPVINVRSFSDDPSLVGQLGSALAAGLSDHGVAPTLKHFPGHGDTSTDSHYGLPSVDHGAQVVKNIDLAPFRTAIASGKAMMIMTAHIQYPALDDTMIPDISGGKTIVPATFSRKIITEVLREEMGYQGVIVSDALDMRAISMLTSGADAVSRTFAAGIDIALMPIAIRTPDDINALKALVTTVAARGLNATETTASIDRILSLKRDLDLSVSTKQPANYRIKAYQAYIADPDYQSVAKALAAYSITPLKSDPDLLLDATSVAVVMPTAALADAFEKSLQATLEISVEGYEVGDLSDQAMDRLLSRHDIIIGGNITPADSPVDLGGMDDLLDGIPQDQQIMRAMQRLFAKARTAEARTGFVSLRFPTDALSILAQVDAAWAIYTFKTRVMPDGSHQSHNIDAWSQVFAGERLAAGQIPMQLLPDPEPAVHQQDVLAEISVDQRLGLIVNQSSLVGDVHLIDHLRDSGAQVSKLFAVEHGIRGVEDAGAMIANGIDAKSGIPIVSLYGASKTPRADDLNDVDRLIFDMQDVGVRFYTYASSLHNVMEACAATNTPLTVLDRPNPMGRYIDGPVLQMDFQSFVGMHPVPLLHGLTLGELARMINGEGWLKGAQRCDLTVIPMTGYGHRSPYRLPVRPSPNLPNMQAVKLYPSLALFEATNISIGRGTAFPFQVIGGPNLGFGDFSFTPVSTPGAAMMPKHMNIPLHGDDLRGAKVAGLDIEPFVAWWRLADELGEPFLTRPDWLDKLMGTDKFREQVKAGWNAEQIIASWQTDLVSYRQMRQKYLLYPD